jgi:hypothetical protein
MGRAAIASRLQTDERQRYIDTPDPVKKQVRVTFIPFDAV